MINTVLSHTNNYNDLSTLIKYKISNNETYFIVLDDFTTPNYNVYNGAMLLPTILISDDNNNENLYLSIMYKVRPTSENLKDMDTVGEGIINMTYEDIIGLLISHKIEAFYVNKYSRDLEITDMVNIIKQNK